MRGGDVGGEHGRVVRRERALRARRRRPRPRVRRADVFLDGGQVGGHVAALPAAQVDRKVAVADVPAWKEHR